MLGPSSQHAQQLASLAHAAAHAPLSAEVSSRNLPAPMRRTSAGPPGRSPASWPSAVNNQRAGCVSGIIRRMQRRAACQPGTNQCTAAHGSARRTALGRWPLVQQPLLQGRHRRGGVEGEGPHVAIRVAEAYLGGHAARPHRAAVASPAAGRRRRGLQAATAAAPAAAVEPALPSCGDHPGAGQRSSPSPAAGGKERAGKGAGRGAWSRAPAKLSQHPRRF